MDNFKVYGYEMARISEVYLSTLSAIMKPFGLERGFYPLLYLCENSGKVSQKDLAEYLRRDKVSTMRVVDYLCSKDLLIRKQDCSDRRCQLLEVTPKGLQLQSKIQKAVEQTNSILFRDFTDQDKAVFKASMDKLYATTASLPEPDFIVKAFKRNKK